MTRLEFNGGNLGGFGRGREVRAPLEPAVAGDGSDDLHAAIIYHFQPAQRLDTHWYRSGRSRSACAEPSFSL